jgi:hypothetical protein
MQNSYAALILAVFCAPCAGYAMQSAPGGTAAQAPATQTPSAQAAPASTPASPAQGTVSGLLQPSLDTLQQTIGALNIEKWKRGTVRDEAVANASSIQRDLQSTLPALLTAVDAAPRTTSKALPVSRNVDALYDVVLRVVDGARVAAPADQLVKLQDALSGLDKARHAFNDHIQETAASTEKQVSDLQVALKAQAQAVPVCPAVAPPPAPAPAPAKKPIPKKRKPVPAAKPAVTPPPANAQPAGATKPNPSN